MIDIIIPTYKPSGFLVECFLSLQNQTLSFDRFKVTVVLNGDKEPYYSNIQAILKKFSFNYSLIYTEEKGVSNARNIGLEITNFPYIFFLDDDDILTENYYDDYDMAIPPPAVDRYENYDYGTAVDTAAVEVVENFDLPEKKMLFWFFNAF